MITNQKCQLYPRCPRYVLALWLIVSRLPFVNVPIGPFSARCPRYVLALWLITSQFSFGQGGHQPFFCPMSTAYCCSVSDYQSVVFWSVCPSALFLPDVHGGALLCWWLSACCLLVSVAISPFLARCPQCVLALRLIVSHLPFVNVPISLFSARWSRCTVYGCTACQEWSAVCCLILLAVE